MNTAENQIQWYTRSSLDAIPCMSTCISENAWKYLTALLVDGPRAFIDNVHTELALIQAGQHLLPCTINSEEYNNSIICSTYNHYISSGLAWMDKNNITIKDRMLRALLRGFGRLLQKGKINKTVCVNNWLLSPNPILKIDDQTVLRLKDFLTEMFPGHAIVFRSITRDVFNTCFHALNENDFIFIPTRQVYLTDGSEKTIFNTRIFKSDRKFFSESGCRVLDRKDISEGEIAKLHKLYCDLNIRKYSPFNPNYNMRFIQHVLNNDFFHIKALKLKEEIAGVAGYYCQEGMMSSFFFGYNPFDVSKSGVYRLLNTVLMFEAEKNGLIYHQGSGGSFYKTIRRAKPVMEYIAVYHRHLPPHRRLIWQTLKQSLDRIGVRFIKGY